MEESGHSNSNPRQLTKREMEILKLVIMGKTNTEIAKELDLSTHTIKAHVCTILAKFDVDDRLQAAVKAIRDGIVK